MAASILDQLVEIRGPADPILHSKSSPLRGDRPHAIRRVAVDTMCAASFIQGFATVSLVGSVNAICRWPVFAARDAWPGDSAPNGRRKVGHCLSQAPSRLLKKITLPNRTANPNPNDVKHRPRRRADEIKHSIIGLFVAAACCLTSADYRGHSLRLRSRRGLTLPEDFARLTADERIGTTPACRVAPNGDLYVLRCKDGKGETRHSVVGARPRRERRRSSFETKNTSATKSTHGECAAQRLFVRRQDGKQIKRWKINPRAAEAHRTSRSGRRGLPTSTSITTKASHLMRQGTLYINIGSPSKRSRYTGPAERYCRPGSCRSWKHMAASGSLMKTGCTRKRPTGESLSDRTAQEPQQSPGTIARFYT